MPDETKPKRTTQEINQDYSNLAYRSGNLQYKISEETKELALLNSEMRDLNFEFVAAKTAEDKAAAEAAAKPAEAATEAS